MAFARRIQNPKGLYFNTPLASISNWALQGMAFLTLLIATAGSFLMRRWKRYTASTLDCNSKRAKIKNTK